MGDVVGLLFHGTIERWMAVAVQIDPNGGGAVEIFLALSIDEIRAATAFDDNRILLFPFLHLREGVPEIPMVPLAQSFRR